MGMDMAEVIMEVEDAFDINIDDSSWTKMRTVASLYALILNRLGVKQGDVCLSSAVCFRLRRVMLKQIGVTRKDFRVNTPLKDLIPLIKRQRTWKAIRSETGWSLPKLERSRPVIWTLRIGWAVVAVALGFYFKNLGYGAVFALVFVASVLYVIAAAVVTAPLAVHFPADCQSVRASVNRIVDTNYGKLVDEYKCSDPDAAWKILKQIIVERLGVAPEKVTPEARFTEDLNCG